MLISGLHKRFRIDAAEAPSTEAEIAKLRKFSPIPLPEFYLKIIRQGSELEILVDGKMYIRFWGASGCLDMNPDYGFQNRLGSCLAIGDDEGGQALVLVSERLGFSAGLYLIDFSCLDLRYSYYIAGSLEDLLVKGVGAETIYKN